MVRQQSTLGRHSHTFHGDFCIRLSHTMVPACAINALKVYSRLVRRKPAILADCKELPVAHALSGTYCCTRGKSLARTLYLIRGRQKNNECTDVEGAAFYGVSVETEEKRPERESARRHR